MVGACGDLSCSHPCAQTPGTWEKQPTGYRQASLALAPRVGGASARRIKEAELQVQKPQEQAQNRLWNSQLSGFETANPRKYKHQRAWKVLELHPASEDVTPASQMKPTVAVELSQLDSKFPRRTERDSWPQWTAWATLAQGRASGGCRA